MLKHIGIFSLVFLVACSQQAVRDIRPEIDFAEKDLGRGRAVFLDVIESADSSASHQLIAQSIVDENFSLPLLLKREVRAALYNFGFTTGHVVEESDIELQVELVDLTHIVTDNKVLASLFLRNEIRLVLKKTGVVHTFTYATQRTEKFPLAPSIQASRDEISLIIADTLRRAFKDPAFLDELSAE